MLDDLSVFNPSHFNAVQQDDSIRWGYSEDLPDVPNPDACSVDDKVCFGDEIVIEHFDELKRGEILRHAPSGLGETSPSRMRVITINIEDLGNYIELPLSSRPVHRISREMLNDDLVRLGVVRHIAPLTDAELKY